MRKFSNKDIDVPSEVKLIPRSNFSQQQKIKAKDEIKEVTNGTNGPLANELWKLSLKSAQMGPSRYIDNFLERKKARVTGDFTKNKNEELEHASCSTVKNTQPKPSCKGFINRGTAASCKDLSVSKLPSNDCEAFVQRKFPQARANPNEGLYKTSILLNLT